MPDPKKKKKEANSIYNKLINSLGSNDRKEKTISSYKSNVSKRNRKEEEEFAKNLLSEALKERKEYEAMLTKHADAYKTDPRLKQQVLDKMNTIDGRINEYNTTINNKLPNDVTKQWSDTAFNSNQVPFSNDYGLGGTIGGLLGAGIGTLIAPGIGTKIGGTLGSTIGGGIDNKIASNKQEEALAQQQEAQQQVAQANYDSQIGSSRLAGYNNSVNNVINPVAQGYAFGGMINPSQGEGIINETNMNTFGNGGTHEQNPHGGIPQGMGENGKMNTVEANEVSIKLGKDKKYIFSDRLIFNSI